MAVSSDWQNLRNAVWECMDNAFKDLVTCVIWLDEDGQRPEPTYASIKINNPEESQAPELDIPPEKRLETLSSLRGMNFFLVYRLTARMLLQLCTTFARNFKCSPLKTSALFK